MRRTLVSYWIDLVQIGATDPASVAHGGERDVRVHRRSSMLFCEFEMFGLSDWRKRELVGAPSLLATADFRSLALKMRAGKSRLLDATCSLLLLLSISAPSARAARSFVYAPADYTEAPPCALHHGSYGFLSLFSIDANSSEDCSSWLENNEEIFGVDTALQGLDDAHELIYVSKPRWIHGSDEAGFKWYDKVSRFIDGIYEQARAAADQFPRWSGQTNQYILSDSSLDEGLSTSQLLLIQSGFDRPEILLKSPKTLIYIVPKVILPILDQIFPADAVLVSIPFYDLPRMASNKSAPDWLKQALANVHYSPLFDAIIQDIDPKQIQKDVRHLTAEDGQAAWQTRHSFTTGGKLAADWIKGI